MRYRRQAGMKQGCVVYENPRKMENLELKKGYQVCSAAQSEKMPWKRAATGVGLE